MSEPIFDKEIQRLMQAAAMMNGVFEIILAPTSRQKWLVEEARNEGEVKSPCKPE